MGVHNKITIYNGIKLILSKNYGVEIDLLDLNSLIDSTLTYEENYNIIFNYAKKRGLIKKISF